MTTEKETKKLVNALLNTYEIAELTFSDSMYALFLAVCTLGKVQGMDDKTIIKGLEFSLDDCRRTVTSTIKSLIKDKS